MAADLYIHVFEGVTEEELEEFFSNTFGSKHFNLNRPRRDDIYLKVADTPQIWIGEVSWLKAMVFGDSEEFIPNTVGAINRGIGEVLPVINDKLIAGIMGAFDLPNDTSYALAKPEDVRAFLEKHRGKRVFTVSW